MKTNKYDMNSSLLELALSKPDLKVSHEIVVSNVECQSCGSYYDVIVGISVIEYGINMPPLERYVQKNKCEYCGNRYDALHKIIK